MVEYVGMAPLVPEGSSVDFEIDGYGWIDLHNDANLVNISLSAGSNHVSLELVLIPISQPDVRLSVTFSDIVLLTIEKAGEFAPGDEELFNGLEYWVNDGGGFALDTALIYCSFRASKVVARVRG
jgi:hypothetical protein